MSMTRPIRVLLLEDNPTDALLFEEALAEVPSLFVSLTRVGTLNEGIARMAAEPFDVAVVDLGLPDSQGLETLRAVIAQSSPLAVVVLTGLDDEELGSEAVRAGAQDYLVKREIRGAVLARTLRYAVERARTEAQLEAARDEALEASRLKSAFLANISHEIRTPISIISGFVGLIGERALEVGDAPILDCVDPIRRSCARLLGTVESILDLSKIDAGTFTFDAQPVDAAQIVEATIGPFRSLAEQKGLTFEYEVRTAETVVTFDEYCLSRVVAHLVDNAIKFTEHGVIHVELGRGDDGALRLEIRDTGVGILPTFVGSLFEPFSQQETGSSRRFEGNGLGLTLTKRFLDLHGATIAVESVHEHGSTFRVRFATDAELAQRRGPAILTSPFLVRGAAQPWQAGAKGC